MIQENLRSYLHDHLAGAMMGVELIEFLISLHDDEPLARFFTDLHREVEADRETLRVLIDRLDFAPGVARQAAGWMMEKMARVKFLLAGPGKGNLGRLEALEMLATGIEGKEALWTALTVIPDPPAPLRSLDLTHLQQRARDQRALVEARRLEAALAAFTSPE